MSIITMEGNGREQFVLEHARLDSNLCLWAASVHRAAAMLQEGKPNCDHSEHHKAWRVANYEAAQTALALAAAIIEDCEASGVDAGVTSAAPWTGKE